MNLKILSLIFIFMLLLMPLSGATSSSSNLSITFIPMNIDQPYFIHIQNKTFNVTYQANGTIQIIDLSKGIYYINITSINYNPIFIKVNLTQNLTYKLYFTSNIIGYGIENYDYQIFFIFMLMAIFGIMIVMVYYLRGLKIK